jgi:protein-L-isoaspartate(D-aspartate) O-methyltransferase
VLELGTGSGYQTAVLAELAGRVISVERLSDLLEAATDVLARLGYTNVELHSARDDVLGWPDGAPYDAILVAAGAPALPPALADQLGLGGRLVIPVGGREEQELVRATRTATGLQVERLGGCRFVPLIGPAAWPDDPALVQPVL